MNYVISYGVLVRKITADDEEAAAIEAARHWLGTKKDCWEPVVFEDADNGPRVARRALDKMEYMTISKDDVLAVAVSSNRARKDALNNAAASIFVSVDEGLTYTKVWEG